MKKFLRSLVPRRVWRTIAIPYHFVNNILNRVRRPYRIWKWKQQLIQYACRAEQLQTGVGGVNNRLPNSGGIAINTKHVNVKDVIEAGYSKVEKRQSGLAGFEGLALDDALGWIEEYRHYSFVPLARAVSDIARFQFRGRGFSVLELGCGWGGFRVLLESFGAAAYLGIDANPIPFSYSPFMLEAPDKYRLLNLQEKIDFCKPFDVVCSFEVLEHIREDRLDCIFQTILSHLSKDSLFIGTAAVTDYTDVHVTVHGRNWWLERFQEHGMVPVCRGKESEWLKLLGSRHPFNWDSSTTSIFVLQKCEDCQNGIARNRISMDA